MTKNCMSDLGRPGPCRVTLKEDEILPDLWSLGALVCSLFGVTMHSKGGAWAGAVFATGAFCNKRSHDSDWKQIYTGVMFSFSALFVTGMNAYQGMKAREAAAAGGAAM